MSKGFKQGGRVCLWVFLLCLLGSGAVHGLPWSSDLYRRPPLQPGWELKAPPQGSVPVNGIEPPLPSRIRAGRTLKNPVEKTGKSVAKGKLLFGTYCTPCHGREGRGDGPVAGKMTAPPDLRSPEVKRRPDGFLYATVRSGGVFMPGYGSKLSPRERWHVVNYIRSLQEP